MTQSQREALLDLLILSVFIDSHLSLKEDEALQTICKMVGWESSRPREMFFYSSMNRARAAANSDAATADYVHARAGVFTDAGSRAAALESLHRLFTSDGIASTEAAFITRVQAAFSTVPLGAAPLPDPAAPPRADA